MDLNKLFNISDEVILLLGFTGPIGRQFATVFAESGCTLVLGDNSENGRDLAESIKKMNRNTEYIRLDVTDETDVRDAVSYVAEKYGLISVLVNNFSAWPESLRRFRAEFPGRVCFIQKRRHRVNEVSGGIPRKIQHTRELHLPGRGKPRERGQGLCRRIFHAHTAQQDG